MVKKQIKINCIGADTVHIDKLETFQGGLKELSEESYQKLKNLILEHGIIAPINVWEFTEETLVVLDGHQRNKALIRMRNEGFIIPKLPINYINAVDEQDAKRKLLCLTSTFGTMTQESLIEFCTDAEIDVEETLAKYRFVDIEWETKIDDKEDVASKNEGTSEPNEKTTIKVKVLAEDRDEAIKKIEKCLMDFDELEVL
jgi:hypothetical protein